MSLSIFGSPSLSLSVVISRSIKQFLSSFKYTDRVVHKLLQRAISYHHVPFFTASGMLRKPKPSSGVIVNLSFFSSSLPYESIAERSTTYESYSGYVYKKTSHVRAKRSLVHVHPHTLSSIQISRCCVSPIVTSLTKTVRSKTAYNKRGVTDLITVILSHIDTQARSL